MCELIVVVCFCLVEFSFASFFLGPGVTLFFPYKELLIHRHRTWRSNKDLKYLKEAQLDILGLPSQPHYTINIYWEYQWCIGLIISIESTSIQNHHSNNDQANRKTSQLQDQWNIFSQRYGSYTKCWLSSESCMKYVILWQESQNVPWSMKTGKQIFSCK